MVMLSNGAVGFTKTRTDYCGPKGTTGAALEIIELSALRFLKDDSPAPNHVNNICESPHVSSRIVPEYDKIGI